MDTPSKAQHPWSTLCAAPTIPGPPRVVLLPSPAGPEHRRRRLDAYQSGCITMLLLLALAQSALHGVAREALHGGSLVVLLAADRTARTVGVDESERILESLAVVDAWLLLASLVGWMSFNLQYVCRTVGLRTRTADASLLPASATRGESGARTHLIYWSQPWTARDTQPPGWSCPPPPGMLP